jgi:RNA polymerase sigma factor (sigma-70 family)
LQGGSIISAPENMKNSIDKDLAINFTAAYENYHIRVFKHIAYLTGNMNVAEDLTQEVFIRLYNNPPEHSNVIAWLMKVSNNLSYNFIRDENAKKIKEPVLIEDEADKVILIEDRVIKNQEIRMTKKILDCMAERDRICLLLKFSGYKYNEIAEAIGVEKTSVGTILARAQEKFREKFMRQGVQDHEMY